MQTRNRRLVRPHVRESDTLLTTTRDEALDRVASGFRRTRDQAGPDALGIFSCSRATNEVNYLAQKLARAVFGTHNVDSCNRT